MPGIRNPSPIALDKGGGKGGGVAVIVPVGVSCHRKDGRRGGADKHIVDVDILVMHTHGAYQVVGIAAEGNVDMLSGIIGQADAEKVVEVEPGTSQVVGIKNGVMRRVGVVAVGGYHHAVP